MHHTLLGSGDATQGHIHAFVEHLRECVEKVAAFLLAKAAAAVTIHSRNARSSVWLGHGYNKN